MLDEPPLIVRMRGLVGFMDDSSIIPQSDQLLRRATPAPTKLAAHIRNDRAGFPKLAIAAPI
jgi:hypothetical protein